MGEVEKITANLKVLIVSRQERSRSFATLFDGIAQHFDTTVIKLSKLQIRNFANTVNGLGCADYERVIFDVPLRRIGRHYKVLRKITGLILYEEDAWQEFSKHSKYYNKFTRIYQSIGACRLIMTGYNIGERIKSTGLDVVVQRQILMMLRNLKDELGLTAVFISHDLSVVAETCDRVAVMYAGKIMEESDTIALYKTPLHPYSKALIGAYPSLKGERRQLKSIPGAPPSLIDPPPGCRFAPRCELAQDICSQKEPAVNTIDGRRVACHMVK